jgi:hypothetical protein
MKIIIDINVHMSSNRSKKNKLIELFLNNWKSNVCYELYKPNIAYSVSKLSRFTSNPSMDHWKAIKKVHFGL